jgi:peptidoglycan/xylan/chitin deacetylase (PgdA/CDA1 family)
VGAGIGAETEPLKRIFVIGWPYLAIVLYTMAFSAITMSKVGPPEALREAAARSSPRVAITFDDLPWNGPGYSDAGIADLTDTLLSTLTARGVPATGLVTCRGIRDGAPIVGQWLDAGLELGNHSFTHRDLNSTPVAEWLEDVRRCDVALREVVGGPVRWFRYPMLHQGDDRSVRDSVARTLKRWGYSNAHVTVDNSEWLLARAYDIAMLEGDGAEAAAIVRAYLDHLREAAGHFRDAGREKFGREVDHVLLLHANAIAARYIGEVVDGLVADGFTIASLEEVLSDPIYARVDDYVGPTGLSWIYRAAPLSPDDAWDDVAEEDVSARFRWR